MHTTHNAVFLFMNRLSNERVTVYLIKYWHGHTFFLFHIVWYYDFYCYFSDISVNCDGVTGSVGKEVTLTCSVSLPKENCCIKHSWFKYDDLKICKEVVPEGSCEHSKRFTCRYTPNTTMTEKYSFFVQASCGWNKTNFTVITTGAEYTVIFVLE